MVSGSKELIKNLVLREQKIGQKNPRVKIEVLKNLRNLHTTLPRISDFQHFSGTQADNKGTRKQAKCASKRYMNKHITVGMARISSENL